MKCRQPDIVQKDQAVDRANFKTPPFVQSRRQTQILILEIPYVFLWLKFLPSLTLNKLKRFETGSFVLKGFLTICNELTTYENLEIPSSRTHFFECFAPG